MWTYDDKISLKQRLPQPDVAQVLIKLFKISIYASLSRGSHRKNKTTALCVVMHNWLPYQGNATWQIEIGKQREKQFWTLK